VIHDVVSRISLRAMDPTQIKLLGSSRSMSGVGVAMGRKSLMVVVIFE
jgi:hypothetical protein